MSDRGSDGGPPALEDVPVIDDVVLRYATEEDAYRASFDPGLLPPSVFVPLAVGELRGDGSDSVPVLHGSLDPSALDRLCAGETVVEFTYAGYRVRLDGRGEVLIRELDR
ncbi:hypothetical protein Hbl1158_10450 [Halobaculum sp. CBA1158]|uniref:HalOD1 output domain-containing protein n=1 Tax=Halobaculum sp. CBA1158 TaxID=2904243 RepID=UPI001F37481A|nr:HalOD1 output domain-containing protein [Halobaculum sp. CBA1158]UIO98954.1 hypothetical protein Hbl1158_10450 [Halobaculum sp. CBA1158]